MKASVIYEDKDNEDGVIRKFKITGRLSAYDPGQICGPPESCYPPEGGELEEIEDVELMKNEEELEPNDEIAEKAFKERLNSDEELINKITALFDALDLSDYHE